MRSFANALLFASAFVSAASAAALVNPAVLSSPLNGQAGFNSGFNSFNNPFASIGALNGGIINAFDIQSQQLADICGVLVGNVVPQVNLFNNNINNLGINQIGQINGGFFQGNQFAQFQNFAQSNIAPLLSNGLPVVFNANGQPTFVNFDQNGNVQQLNAQGQNLHFDQAGAPVTFVNGIPQLAVNGQQVDSAALSQLFQSQISQFNQFQSLNGQQLVNNVLPSLLANGQPVVINQFGQPTALTFNQFGQVQQFDNECQNLLFDTRGLAVQFVQGLPILRDSNGNLVQVDFNQQLAQFQQSASQVGLFLNINAAGAQNLNALQQIQFQGLQNVNVAASASNVVSQSVTPASALTASVV